MRKRGFSFILAITIIISIFPFATAAPPEPETVWMDESYDFFDSWSYFSNGICRGAKDLKLIYRIWGTEEEIVFRTSEEMQKSTENLVSARVENNFGFIDQTGKEVIPFIYDSIGKFSKNVAIASKIVGLLPNTDGFKKTKYGLIDNTGNELTPFIYDRAENFSEGLAKVQEEHEYRIGNHGFIDTTGNVVIPFIYLEAFSFSEGLAAVRKADSVNKTDAWGYIDKTGKEVLPFVFDRAYPFSEGLAKIEKIGSFRTVDTNNTNNARLAPPMRKFGFIDKTGTVVIPCIYDAANDFSNGLTMVRKGDDVLFIDQAGQEVAPPEPETNVIFSEGLAAVGDQTGTKRGYIDNDGNEIIPYIYDGVRHFSEGLASVKKDNKWGYIDRTGKEVIPFIYDSALGFSENLAMVKKDGRWGIIKNIYTVTVTLNGQYIKFDQPPIIENERTLVPLRVIFEALNAEVNWNEDTQEITAVCKTCAAEDIAHNISTKIDDPYLYIYKGKINPGELPPSGTARIELDVPPMLVGGRTLVPLRAVAASFDAQVDWDDGTQTVIITK